jgi:hypothetical protein
MRKNAVLASVSALVLSAAGFIIRRAQLATGYEPSGLPVRGAAVSTAMTALTAVVIIAALAAAIIVKIRSKPIPGYKNAFADVGLSYFLLILLVGVAWIVASALHYMSLRAAAPVPTVDAVFCILSALSALSVILLAYSSYTGRKFGMSLIFTIVPELFFCLWLVLLYRANQTNPVLSKYVYECLAIASSTISFYSVTAYAYGKTVPGLAIFGFSTSIFFCGATLSDNLATPLKIIFAAVLVCQTANLARFTRNLQSSSENSAATDALRYLGLEIDDGTDEYGDGDEDGE